MRLAALALDRGRLTDDLVTALAVRGTLLVDLALRGRVRETEDAVEFDDPPTGFAPADWLLGQGAESLTALLRRGPVDQRDLAAEHVRRGSWRSEEHTSELQSCQYLVCSLLLEKKNNKNERCSAVSPCFYTNNERRRCCESDCSRRSRCSRWPSNNSTPRGYTDERNCPR